ncbi:MAG: transglutaminase domain-containing protein [Chitinophagales bacterium]
MKQLITFLFFSLLVSGSIMAQKDRDFSQVDAHSKTNPAGKAIDMATLTKYLTEEYDNDFDKVRAIAVWISNNIAIDVDAVLNQKEEDVLPTDIILRRLAGPEHHAHLFLAMCQEAKIKCYKVRGYLKDMFYDEGDSFYITNHTWNAVELDSTWYMVDMALLSGSIESIKQIARPEDASKHDPNSQALEWTPRFREAYFLAHPKDWILTHLPADPMWQLNYHPMPLDTFEHGNESVVAFLAANPTDTTLHYNRHLAKYDLSHSFYKPVYIAENALEFNPRNHKLITYSSASYALDLTESRTRNVSVCKQAKKHYLLALENAQKYKEDISAMYSRDKNKLTTQRSEILTPNKSYTIRNTKMIEGFDRESDRIGERISRLSERAKDWESKAKEATSDNLKDTTKPKNQREEADSLLKINQEIIQKNELMIEEAMSDSKSLRDSTQYYYKKIAQNWEFEHAFAPQVLQNVDLRIQLNISQAKLEQLKPYGEKIDSLKSICIQDIQNHNDAILDTIEMLIDIKGIKDSSAIAMLKENKKLLRQNKRMMAADMGEDAQYDALNQKLKVAYDLKNQDYYDKMSYQKDFLNKLQEDRKLAIAENKLLELEQQIEDQLFEKRVAFVKSLSELRKEQLTEITTKCKDRMKIVDGILREAGETD